MIRYKVEMMIRFIPTEVEMMIRFILTEVEKN